MPSKMTRRACLGLFTLAASPAAAQFAIYTDEANPTDLVPGYYSLNDFLDLNENEIYMVNLAIRRGRRIRIEGFKPSESKAIIQRAAQDWPSTRRSLGGN